MKKRVSLFRPPTLRTRKDEEHKVTWLELFYDLVFVVAVAELGGRLLNDVGDHRAVEGVLGFVGFFIPIWWAWAGFTFYADRYDTDDLGQRVLAVAQMVAVALMATSVSATEAASSTLAFGAAYVGARLVLIVMYLRARWHVPETRTLVSGYLVGLSIEVVLWSISLFVATPFRFWLWAVGLAISFATPWVMRKEQARVPLSTSHLPERFGLFTILVLGEAIAAVVVGLTEVGWQAGYITTAIFGVVIATTLWWVYFDNLHGSVVRRREGQTRAWKPTAWIYSHLPLAIAVTACGVSIEFLVSHHVGDTERWLLVGSIALALLAMAINLVSIESADPTRRDVDKAYVRFVTAGVVLLVGVFGSGLNAPLLAGLLAAICCAQVAVDLAINHIARARHFVAEIGGGDTEGHRHASLHD